jgi:hypothetical protein
MSKGLADDRMQVAGAQSGNLEDASVSMLDPVLPNDATKSFTLLASNYNSESLGDQIAKCRRSCKVCEVQEWRTKTEASRSVFCT